MIIAIDGPGGAGKGTLAIRLAGHFGLPHLDTGKLYRAVGWSVLQAGGDPSDPRAATEAARLLDTELLPARLADPALRCEAAASAASQVAAIGPVRAALLDLQRRFAARPPGAILDGRDIGTIVCPTADIKLFVTASIAARTERRLKELLDAGHPAIRERVLADMQERDARDSQRADAPLRPADDAVLIDTSALDADAAFAAALAIIAQRGVSTRV